MEHARIIIAIVLSFLVFLLYDLLFEPKPVQKPRESPSTAQPQPPAGDTSAKPYTPETARTPESSSDSGTSAATMTAPTRPDRLITVETPFYRAVFSEQGAALKSYLLKEFRESPEEDAPLKEMVPPDLDQGTLRFRFRNNSLPQLENAVYTAESGIDQLDVREQPQTLVFRWVSEQGHVVEKTYRFSPESYMIGLSVSLKNGSDAALQDAPTLSIFDFAQKSRRAIGFEGPSAMISGSVEEFDVDDISEGENFFPGKIQWAGIVDRYFLSAVVPGQVQDAAVRLALPTEKIVTVSYVEPETILATGTQKTFEYRVFFGPKSFRLLSRYNNNLDAAIDFGMFDFLAKPLLWIMNFIYDHLIPNYGVAIILVTLAVKVLLWPLGTKSYKSMSEMKKLQPLIKELREKYKDDRKKMNEETMALYRTYKINPLGGCLPMLVQIPVFLAFYNMLYEAIELRHAPFLLWINDLSAPDRLFRFGFSIPFMEPPYGIPVLTLIMGASMLLQQKMAPPMGDPTQAKMMMLMPVVFTFIFINFSSGLVLYWLVNNLFSIGQQYYVTQKAA